MKAPMLLSMSDAPENTQNETNDNHHEHQTKSHDHKHGNSRTPSSRPDSPTSLGEWDDDDFEMAELPLLEVARREAGRTSNEEGNPATRNKDNDNETNNDNGWFRPLATAQETAPRISNSGARDDKKKDDKELFLTKQFHRLSTPVSQKKMRCVVCTRPVASSSSSAGFVTENQQHSSEKESAALKSRDHNRLCQRCLAAAAG